MATKSEQFRTEQQRNAHAPLPKTPPRKRRDTPVNTAEPGTSASDRKAGMLGTAERNRSDQAARRGGSKLENSESGKPSRKSTRKSEGHIKLASNLQRRVVRKTHSPKARATRAAVKGQR